ncbi:MAG: hypothetical protein JNL28_01455, partial [Planctomycetes bacterium]|nr:hypothetical protein [Planctomycetota bacterium]
MTTATLTELDTKWVAEAVRRTTADLSMLIDRKFEIQSVASECLDHRPAGMGSVHISFKIAVQRGLAITHGTILVPFKQAVTLAGWLQMMSDAEATRRAELTTLDSAMKDGLLEIGNFVAGACEASLRTVGVSDARVVSEGCQGVAADVRPALKYEEGASLTIGRAQA